MFISQNYHVSDPLADMPMDLTKENYLDYDLSETLEKIIELEGVIRVQADLNELSVEVEDEDVLEDVEEILNINSLDWCDLESLGIRGSEEGIYLMDY